MSLSKEDVELLDEYAKKLGIGSRSAVVQRAVRLLRSTGLGTVYAAAFEEWETGGDAEGWEWVIADGLDSSRD